jgi:hypothetical protein
MTRLDVRERAAGRRGVAAMSSTRRRPQHPSGQAVALAALALALAWAPFAGAQTIPSDPAVTCSVPGSELATWFQAGSPVLNGVVNPANGVAFSNNPNCDFYKWAEQMFLWATSPAPPVYGGGDRILDSRAFFDVSPEDANGNRTFLAHNPGFRRSLNIRVAQLGPGKLPLVFDSHGRPLEVVGPQVQVLKLPVRDRSGRLVEAARARRVEGGRLEFLDKAGQAIERAPMSVERHVRLPGAMEPLRVQRFLFDGLPVFLDPFGHVVDVEQGQADQNVLLAQNGSLVYYATMVNNVFAYFLTGVKDGAIAATRFPTTMGELAAVTAFAAGKGVTLNDPSALAVELKSSWVEAASLPDASGYVTMTATVPTYDTTNPAQWIPSGQKTIKLAMVGLHVVGSVAGHPEMIWATFEHFGNAPNAAFAYVNDHGAVVNVPQSTAGSWLFAAGGSAGPFNQPHMHQSGANLVPSASFSIGPSDTIRWKPWGAASDLSPNPIDGSSAASNTEIIAINNSVRGQLAAGDLRGNYFMTGATWTIGGAAPNGFNQVGTSKLANTTMETYNQGVDTRATATLNCFGCHAGNDTGVSHVFGARQPLP